jgi:hypothetical protein
LKVKLESQDRSCGEGLALEDFLIGELPDTADFASKQNLGPAMNSGRRKRTKDIIY